MRPFAPPIDWRIITTMLPDPTHMQNRDPLDVLSEKLVEVSSMDGLLEAVMQLLGRRGPCSGMMYKLAPSTAFDSRKLRLVAQKNNTTQAGTSNWNALLQTSSLNASHFQGHHPTLVEDTTKAGSLGEDVQRIFAANKICSAALLPQKVNGNWIGIICVAWDSPQTFSELDESLFTRIARQTSWAAYGLMVSKETRVQFDGAKLLLQLNTALSQVTDERQILEALAQIAVRNGADTLLLTYVDVNEQDNSATLTIVARWTREAETRPPK